MHVKKGDKVVVISGKDKGKQGVILAAFPKKERVLVEGINLVKNTLNQPKLTLKAEFLNKKRRSTYQT